MASNVSIETKNKIIDAALNIIAEEGFQNLTTRKVASLANVNVALLHYHFGTKENIINEALSKLTNEYFHTFEILKSFEFNPRERLKRFFLSYADITVKYPDIIKNFIVNSIFSYSSQSKYLGFIQKEGLDLMKSTVKEMNIHDDDKVIVMKLVQIISGLAFPVLLGEPFEYISGIKFEDREARQQYICLMIESFFP